MSKQKIIVFLEEVMEVNKGTLKSETLLDEVDEWDSMAKLSLMVEVKKKWNVMLEASDINEFVTVGDICDGIETRMAR